MAELYRFKSFDIDGIGTSAVPGTEYTELYNHVTGEMVTVAGATDEEHLSIFTANSYGNLIAKYETDMFFGAVSTGYPNAMYKDFSIRITLAGTGTISSVEDIATFYVGPSAFATPSGSGRITVRPNLQGFMEWFPADWNIANLYTVESDPAIYPFDITIGYSNNGQIIYVISDGIRYEQNLGIDYHNANDGVNAGTEFRIVEFSEIVISGTPSNIYFTCGKEIADNQSGGAAAEFPDSSIPVMDSSEYLGWQARDWTGPDTGMFTFHISTDNATASPIEIGGLSSWNPGETPVSWTGPITIGTDTNFYEYFINAEHVRGSIIGIVGPVPTSLIVKSLCMGKEIEPPLVKPKPVLDFAVPSDRSIYLDLVSKDNPLAGWTPGQFREENDNGTLQIVENYYGQRVEMPLTEPGN